MTATATRERPILFSGEMVRAILAGRKTQTRRVMNPAPSDFVTPPNVHPPKHAASYFDAYCGARQTEANPRGMSGHWCWWTPDNRQSADWIRCPFGVPGDRLWVRETWCYATDSFAVSVGAGYQADGKSIMRGGLPASTIPDGALVFNGHSEAWPANVTRWRPSIHMPRWASRLTLEVTDVRVERLQDMPYTDAIAEGIEPVACKHHGSEYGNCSDCMGTGIAEDPRPDFAALWDRLNAPRGYSWDVNPWVWAISFRKVANAA